MKVFQSSIKIISTSSRELFNFTKLSKNNKNSFFSFLKVNKVNFSSEGGCGSSCGCHGEKKKEDPIEKKLKGMNYEIIECINQGKYEESLEKSNAFINEVKSNYGDEHPFYCSALNNKAFILKTCGMYDEAQVIFEDVIEKYKKLYGENNEKVLITMHNLGTLLRDAKEYDKSLEIYEKLLKMVNNQNIEIEGEKTGNLRLNIIANIYNSAGGLYRQLKHFAEADKYFALSYSIIKENFGEHTLPIAMVLNNMALCLKDQGKYDLSMEKYNKVLEIRKELLPQDHPDLNLIKHNIEQLKNEMSSSMPNSNNNI